MDDRLISEDQPEPKKRGVVASWPHGVAQYSVGQVCQHRKYNYICVIYGWDQYCKASRVRLVFRNCKNCMSQNNRVSELDLTNGSGQAGAEGQAAILQRARV